MSLAHILLVEDSHEDAELTMEALGDYRLKNPTVWVKDGAEALDYLFCRGEHAGRATGMPIVVLLDIKMPKLDGLEVLRRLRAEPETHRLPVVMLTSSREEPDIARSYDLGANGFVVKPVQFADFTEAVRRIGAYWILTNEVAPENH